MSAWSIAILVLFAGFVSAEQDEARKQYEEHLERGLEIVRSGEGSISIGKARQAADVFRLAAEYATNAGLHQKAVDTLRHRQTLLEKIEDPVGQLETCELILAAQEKLGPKAREDRCSTLLDIGYLQLRIGVTDEAVRTLERAEAEYREMKHPYGIALAQIRRAEAERCSFRYADALRHAEAAFPVLDAGRPVIVSDDPEEVEEDRRSIQGERLGAIGVVARLHLELGTLERANELYQRGLDLTEDGFPLYRAEYLLSVSDLLRTEGAAPAEVEEPLHEACSLFYDAHRLRGATRVLLRLAVVRADQGNYRAAVTLSNSAFYVSAYAEPDPWLLHRVNTFLGNSNLFLKDWKRARAEFEASLELAEDLRNPGLLGITHAGLAEVSIEEERIDDAVRHVRLALDEFALTSRGLSPATMVNARQNLEYLSEIAVRVGFAVNEPAVTFELLDRTRACALIAALGGRETACGPRDEVGLRAVRKAKAEVAGLESQFGFARRAGDFGTAQALLNRLKKAQGDYRLALEHGGSSTVGDVEERTTLKQMQDQRLRKGDALVLFGFDPDYLHAMVVTKDTATCHPRIAPAAEIGKLMDRLMLADGSGVSSEEVKKLGPLLLGGMDLGDGVERVLVCPDGRLSALPLAALFPDREVAFVPSPTCLAALARRESERESGPGARALALADPDYTQEGEHHAQLHRRGVGLYRLKNAGEEIDAFTTTQDVTLRREKATEEAFRRHAGQEHWLVIHFACHGVVNQRLPAWSSLVLSPDGENDGYVAVAEIAAMRVSADLAVLSACSTGRGKAYRGEGTIALPCAFLQAGTPRVIASLWDVDDKATTEFMKLFYGYWRPVDGSKGEPVARALKKAQADLRKVEKYKDPKYWAAWVLWGLPD